MKKPIKFLVASAVVLGGFIAVSCDDEKKSLPLIDGFNNSNEVAVENLKAHWTFDDTNNERLSNTAPSNDYGTVGFADGQIGRALKLTSGALVFPSIPNIGSTNSLGNFTVSMWVNVTNSKRTANAGATALFSLAFTGDTDIWGNINMLAETGNYLPSSDTLFLKPLLKTLLADGESTSLQDNITIERELENGDIVGKHFLGAKRWAHYLITWNGTTHQFEIYADGEKAGAFSDRGDTPALAMRTPTKAIFGSLSYNDLEEFASAPGRGIPLANASIDDVRIFNTELSQAQITALYNLGIAGR